MEAIKNLIFQKIGLGSKTEEPQGTGFVRKFKPDAEYDKVQLQICWILDITGSMSTSIEACKESSIKAAQMISSEGYNVGFCMTTYTEDTKGSYVSYDKFSNVDTAVEFIKKITLCRPPNNPSVSASGDDGDENLKHAMAEFASQHNFDIPSIIFILTDAAYHPITDSTSKTAKCERAELQALRASNDFFEIWNLFNKETCFVFPVIVSSPSCKHHYGLLAKESDGIYIESPGQTATLSKLQVVLIKEIFERLSGGANPTNSTSQIVDKLSEIVNLVKLFDCSGIPKIESEADKTRVEPQLLNAQQAIAFFETQMEKLVKVAGKGWGKRCINFNPISLGVQFNLMIYTLKYFLGDESLKPQIEACLSLIKEHTPEDQQRQISLTMEILEEIKTGITFGEVADEDRDAVTLDTFKEYAEDTSLEDIQADFVAGVASAFYGLPIDIKFPVDVYGRTDFMSAWDAVVSRVGLDYQSLKSFIQLVKESGDGDATAGLTDGHGKYNSFMILSGEQGSLRWAYFKIASCL